MTKTYYRHGAAQGLLFLYDGYLVIEVVKHFSSGLKERKEGAWPFPRKINDFRALTLRLSKSWAHQNIMRGISSR